MTKPYGFEHCLRFLMAAWWETVWFVFPPWPLDSPKAFRCEWREVVRLWQDTFDMANDYLKL